jgi:hypothetical protein
MRFLRAVVLALSSIYSLAAAAFASVDCEQSKAFVRDVVGSLEAAEAKCANDCTPAWLKPQVDFIVLACH